MSRAQLTYEAGVYPGDDQQFNRKWVGQAGNYAVDVTANGQYYTGACYLLGCFVTDTITPNVALHDGTSNTGAKKFVVAASAAPSDSDKYMLKVAIPFNTGIYVQYGAAAVGNVIPVIIKEDS